MTHTRTRIRVLRPLLIPPFFPPSLFPITPIFEPPASRASHRDGVLGNGHPHSRVYPQSRYLPCLPARWQVRSVCSYTRVEGVPTSSFSLTSTVLSSPYMHMPSSPSAWVGGRSSCSEIHEPCVEGSDKQSVADMGIVRGAPVVIVLQEELSESLRRLEGTIDWSCAPIQITRFSRAFGRSLSIERTENRPYSLVPSEAWETT